MSKFATIAGKLLKPVANCSEQTANQNTNKLRGKFAKLHGKENPV